MLPFPESFQNTSPHCVPFPTVVEPLLFCTFLLLTSLTLTVVRPSNIEYFFLRPASFQNDLPCHISMLFSPISFFSFHSHHGLPWFKPCSPLYYSCLAAHFFQYTDRALCTSIFLTSFGHTYLMSSFVSSQKTTFGFLHKVDWTHFLHARSIASYIPCGVSLRLHFCYGSSTSSCSHYPCLGLLVMICQSP